MTTSLTEGRKRPPARRTQTERSETTQRKIINSALRLLQKEGFQKANLQEIARGAKVTLGALQHQFGTRDELMHRIIDEVLAPLEDRGGVWPRSELPLEERAYEFVQRAWSTTYGPPSYLAAWSLFFGCKSTPALFKRIDAHRMEKDPVYFARFLEHFPEIVEHNGHPEHVASLVFSTLRGMAVLRLFPVAQDIIDGQLTALAEIIARAGTPQIKTRRPSSRPT